MQTTELSRFKNSTMSSKDIAIVTGKHHYHVIRDIENMLNDLEIDATKFGSIYKDSYGRDKRVFNLPKRECLILASGYNVKLRALIIDRWAELEANQAPKTFAEALRLAADKAEENERLAIEVQRKEAEIQKTIPIVKFHDKLENDNNTMTLSALCKVISDSGHTQIGTTLLTRKLRELGLLMKDNREPTQKAVNEGLLCVHHIIEKGKKLKYKSMITMKGCRYIIDRIESHNSDFSIL